MGHKSTGVYLVTTSNPAAQKTKQHSSYSKMSSLQNGSLRVYELAERERMKRGERRRESTRGCRVGSFYRLCSAPQWRTASFS